MWSAVVSLVIVCVVIIDRGLCHKELEGQSNTGECASVLGIVPHLVVVVYTIVHFRLILQRQQEDGCSTGS